MYVSCTEGSPEVEGSHVLLAVGRQPNTDDLALELLQRLVHIHPTVAELIPTVFQELKPLA